MCLHTLTTQYKYTMKRKIAIEFNHRTVNPDGTHGVPTGSPMFYDGEAYQSSGLVTLEEFETPTGYFNHMCGVTGTSCPPEFSNEYGYGTSYPYIYDSITYPQGPVVYSITFLVTERTGDELRSLTLEDMKKLFLQTSS